MRRPGKVDFVIEWEQLACTPDDARCFSCGDPVKGSVRRPVCVVSQGSTLQHHILPLLVCASCYVIAIDHLAPRARSLPSVS